MPACHAGDRRFDPGRDRHFKFNNGSVAQLVEHDRISCEAIQQRTNFGFEIWVIMQITTNYCCKDLHYGSVAQLVEQWTENPCVGGSIPSRATIFRLMQYCRCSSVGRARTNNLRSESLAHKSSCFLNNP